MLLLCAQRSSLANSGIRSRLPVVNPNAANVLMLGFTYNCNVVGDNNLYMRRCNKGGAKLFLGRYYSGWSQREDSCDGTEKCNVKVNHLYRDPVYSYNQRAAQASMEGAIIGGAFFCSW